MKRAYNIAVIAVRAGCRFIGFAEKFCFSHSFFGPYASVDSSEYDAMHQETKALLRELMEIPDDYEILFIQGGGSTQFLMTAANFFTKKYAAYVNTSAAPCGL